MARFLQYLFDGLGQGSVYALLALGLVIIYRGTGHLNFAHGEMALLCTYVIWQLHTWGLPIGISLPLGMVFGFGVGVSEASGVGLGLEFFFAEVLFFFGEEL